MIQSDTYNGLVYPAARFQLPLKQQHQQAGRQEHIYFIFLFDLTEGKGEKKHLNLFEIKNQKSKKASFSCLSRGLLAPSFNYFFLVLSFDADIKAVDLLETIEIWRKYCQWVIFCTRGEIELRLELLINCFDIPTLTFKSNFLPSQTVFLERFCAQWVSHTLWYV